MHTETAMSSSTIADVGLMNVFRDCYRETFSMNLDLTDNLNSN